jgi:hypothetical protein
MKPTFGDNVHLEERNEAYWFAPHLIELIDHAPGTEIRLEAVDKRWTRTEDGAWHEESLVGGKKPWWKFW